MFNIWGINSRVISGYSIIGFCEYFIFILQFVLHIQYVDVQYLSTSTYL